MPNHQRTATTPQSPINLPPSSLSPTLPAAVLLVALALWAADAPRCPTPLASLAERLAATFSFSTTQPADDLSIPRPADTFGLDLSLPAAFADAAPQDNRAVARDARQLALFCHAMSRYLAWDGSRSQPTLCFVSQVFDAGAFGQTALTGGEKISTRYPALGPALALAFQRLGPAATPLTPETRAQAVALWHAAAYGLAQAVAQPPAP